MKSRSLLASAAFVATLALPFSARAAGPAPVPPAATAFHLGKLSVTSLADSQYIIPNDAKIFGTDVGADAVTEVLKAAQAPTDTIDLPVDALLVRDGGHVVLIDTGLGAKAGGVLLNSLRLAGVSPADVTDVLITHPHPDHIGGLLTADGLSAFAKAKIRFSGADWTWLQGQADMAALVKTIGPQVETFQPGERMTPSITSVSIKGHTPGHVGYQIGSGSNRLLDIGDAAHSYIISLSKPDWTFGFDSDAQTAKISRRDLLSKLAKDHETIFAPHFPYPGFGSVIAAGNAFAWQPAIWSSVDRK